MLPNWITNNIEIVIAIAAALAYWLNQRKAGADSDESDRPRPRMPGDGMDADETRRLQEEIRRKIEERRAGGAPPPLPHSRKPAQPTVAREMPGQPQLSPLRRMQQELQKRMEEARTRMEMAERDREKRMAEQAERLAQAQREERQRLQEATRLRQSVQANVMRGGTGQAVGGIGLLAGLRGASALRRTMVEIEVLGPPVSLRREPPGAAQGTV